MSQHSPLDDKADVLFTLLDTDGDGAVDRDDYLTEGHRFLDAYDVPVDSPKGKALLGARGAMWERCTALVDHDHDGVISRGEFHEWIKATQGPDAMSIEDVLLPMHRAQFEIIDSDGDGTVDRDEFMAWRTRLGYSRDGVAALFSKTDADKDGRITLDEFHRANSSFAVR
ncbi:EF-hand domain-containing protein [Streptomyces sp. NBC_01320]|uniref:EF-hand domain-containing protein n=1 Tax=Streptomyces sp. NBC_01320 TaxID=2903824 RepID=UPI002E13DC75|nr:EF-hand domain-containing protein [Streptomyces sp. NBC_01320]